MPTKPSRRRPRTGRVFLADGPGTLYFAKLLFQFRVVIGGRSRARRVCEERIVLVRTRTPREALARVKRYGSAGEFVQVHGRRRIHFEFVGVLELSDLVAPDLRENPAEVYYGFRLVTRPMERRRELVPPERALEPFRQGRIGLGRAFRMIYGDE